MCPVLNNAPGYRARCLSANFACLREKRALRNDNANTEARVESLLARFQALNPNLVSKDNRHFEFMQ